MQKTAALSDSPASPQASRESAGEPVQPEHSPGYARLREAARRNREQLQAETKRRSRGEQQVIQPDASTPLADIITSRIAQLTAPNDKADPVDPPALARRGRPPRSPEERELRETFQLLVSDMASLFHDEATVSQSLSRFVHDYQQGREFHPDLTPEAMISLCYEIKSVVQEYSPTIKKLSSHSGLLGVKNKFPYFMELVEVRLGLKQDYALRSTRNRASPPPPDRPAQYVVAPMRWVPELNDGSG